MSAGEIQVGGGSLYLYTVKFEARDGTVLDQFGNQYYSEARGFVDQGACIARDVDSRFGPRSEKPIARIVIEVQK